MVDFAEKLKDVELNPFMLSIYKDDENGTLLNHSFECYIRRRNSDKDYDKFGYRNPMFYVQYPPIDMFKEFVRKNNSTLYTDLKHLKCIECISFVIDEIFKEIKKFPTGFVTSDPSLSSAILSIYNKTGKINEDWMWDYINYGDNHRLTPTAYPKLFTSDQILAFTIMA